MLITNDNLVSIAYKGGYCGSLIYVLLAHSDEVAQYSPINKLRITSGNMHESMPHSVLLPMQNILETFPDPYGF